MNRFAKLSILLLGASAILLGCAKKTLEDELPSIIGTIPFTAGDLAKAWTSNCEAKVDAPMNATHFKVGLTLNSNGTFSFNETAYKTANALPPCSNSNALTYYSVSGTFTVGNAITGGQELNFTTSGNSSLQVYGTDYVATQNAFNANCGGTSPYCSLSGGTCTNNGTGSGISQNSSMMSCMSRTFPTNGTTLYNVASWNGTNFYIGAPTTGVPGVFNTGSRPSSATLFLH